MSCMLELTKHDRTRAGSWDYMKRFRFLRIVQVHSMWFANEWNRGWPMATMSRWCWILSYRLFHNSHVLHVLAKIHVLPTFILSLKEIRGNNRNGGNNLTITNSLFVVALIKNINSTGTKLSYKNSDCQLMVNLNSNFFSDSVLPSYFI